MLNVFARRDGEIRHFYATEKGPTGPGQDDRHVDLLWPLWNVLDLTPRRPGPPAGGPAPDPRLRGLTPRPDPAHHLTPRPDRAAGPPPGARGCRVRLAAGASGTACGTGAGWGRERQEEGDRGGNGGL